MARDYIELSSSNGFISAKFNVLVEGYKVVDVKTANVAETVGGKLDGTFGGVFEIHNYVVKVRYVEDEPGYGDLNTLRSLFLLNDPNATPSTVIKFKDHLYSVPSDEKNVWMLGSLERSALGCEIDNGEAWYLVQLQLRVIP